MKKLLLIAIAFLELNCSDSHIKSESQKNADSNSSISSEKQSVEVTKFVFAVIYHKRGTYVSGQYKSGFEGPLTDYIYYSDIIESTEVDETAKYKFLDNLENELRSEFPYNVHSITKRECLVFDTYIEASEYRRKIRK